MTRNKQFEVAIVGAGPAGLSAALFLARFLHTVVVIDSGDPRNWEARGVHGYLGLHNIPPAELRAKGRAEAEQHGAVFLDDMVDTVECLQEERFCLALRGGAIVEARRLLLAIGIKDVWPDVPELDQCYGETVHHCPDCDGYEARGKKTVVIASGRKAAAMAMTLATWTRELVICTNGVAPEIDELSLTKLDGLGVPILTDKIARLVSKDAQVRALELENGMLLDCERIFFGIGHYPADDLGEQVGCKRDDEGLIEIDDRYHTSVKNVFAAGDIVPGPHLAIAAAADGAIAALSIHRSLVPEECSLE